MSTVLSYIVWRASPVFFTIPGVDFTVSWYSFMWALGIVLSREAGIYILKKEAFYTDKILSLFYYIVIPAIAGARLGHFIFYDPDTLLANPIKVIMPPYSGLASHGGVAGIIAGVYTYCRMNKLNFLWIIDRLAIVSLLTGVAIRIGNLFNSEIVGIPTEVPWAFVFPKVDQLPRHPAQLYEALAYAVIFVALFIVWRRRSNNLGDGFFFGAMMASLWSFRFCIETVKENQVPFEDLLPINMGQILSVPFLLAGLILLAYSFVKKRKTR